MTGIYTNRSCFRTVLDASSAIPLPKKRKSVNAAHGGKIIF